MKSTRALITGIAGFAGSHLAEELLNHGYRVFGTRLKGESTTNLQNTVRDIELSSLDILKPSRCRDLVRRIGPSIVFHLAAQASVGQSFRDERRTFQVNLDGTFNMLEAAREAGSVKAFVFVGSPDAYGLFSPKNTTLTEDQPLRPVSPYGISKAAAEHTARYFHRQHGLPVLVARAFNHSGPRQSEHFVIPAFARQVARIEVGRQHPAINVGDLSARRDLSDVRDIVRGYRLLAERGKPGEVYQLCSGRAVAIRRVLDILLSLSNRRITVKVDKNRLRKSDIPVLRGSNSKARRRLGYRPKYSLKDTLRDTLDYWRTVEGVRLETL